MKSMHKKELTHCMSSGVIGTQVTDTRHVAALSKIFCNNRQDDRSRRQQVPEKNFNLSG